MKYSSSRRISVISRRIWTARAASSVTRSVWLSLLLLLFSLLLLLLGEGHHPGGDRNGQAPHGPEAHPVQRALLQEYCKFLPPCESIFNISVSRSRRRKFKLIFLNTDTFLTRKCHTAMSYTPGNFSSFHPRTIFFSHVLEQNSSRNNYKDRPFVWGKLY